MSTSIHQSRPRNGVMDARAAKRPDTSWPAAADLTIDQIWHELARESFAVLSHVAPDGQPRSSGVVYAVADHRLFVVVAPDSWKARQIPANGKVAVTVPVRRGGLVSLLAPIPPATISFHGEAVVHPTGWATEHPLPHRLVSLLPAGRRDNGCVIEIRPIGEFSIYGLGVSLGQMRNPALARAHAPVG